MAGEKPIDLHTAPRRYGRTSRPGERFAIGRAVGGPSMTWKTPKIVEIALGAEINCYACAELPD
ncbi:pyrroloquinoline quinone precursor peptide PqqA [Sphingosinicellaceae bacterium]|nr:pyrroloquinoline quinone precursor peptide PqqA [Sphingosinicellaceae bacterium]